MTILLWDSDSPEMVTRREAVWRVTAMLGGVALVGGSSLLAACAKEGASNNTPARDGAFTPEDVAFLDDVAETILPATKTPGAKAAKVGAFMTVMVTDSYGPEDRKIFRDGMRALDDASKKMNNASFMAATAAQRLTLLQALDKEQKAHMDARDAARRSDAFLPDQRKENAKVAEAGTSAAPAISNDAPAHYFRMMKELSLLGYFTSEIGCTQAMRYVETPGRFDPCKAYTPGEPADAGHA
jgi:hypothetical protein